MPLVIRQTMIVQIAMMAVKMVVRIPRTVIIMVIPPLG